MSRIPGLIVAAGGIVVRGGEVLLVCRPKYNDWSFPKGKLDNGESPRDAAVREVREETGYRTEPGDLVGSVAYLHKGTPKVVLYWLMTAKGEPAEIHDPEEVSEARWFKVEDARAALTYELERELLAKAVHPPGR